MNQSEYIRQKPQLLKDFDKTVKYVRDVFVARYGTPLAETMIAEARQEYGALIPQLPYIGGKQPFTQFIISTGWALAMYRALQRHGGTVEQAGKLAYQASAAYLRAYPPFLRRLFGRRTFSRRYVARVRQRAAESQQRQYPGDYVYNFVEGDGQTFDYGVDYVECASVKFLQQQGAPELAPYLCAADKLYSEMLGWGLQRTMTLAEGADRCDFRFRRGGETRVAIPEALRGLEA
jgi:hypothetical protein